MPAYAGVSLIFWGTALSGGSGEVHHAKRAPGGIAFWGEIMPLCFPDVKGRGAYRFSFPRSCCLRGTADFPLARRPHWHAEAAAPSPRKGFCRGGHKGLFFHPPPPKGQERVGLVFLNTSLKSCFKAPRN